MTGAVSSAALPYRALVAELKELREVRYETHRRSTSHSDGDIRHQQNERTRGQGHNTCPRLRFQATFRREYKSAHPLLYRKDKGTDDARSHATARKLHAIQNILGGIQKMKPFKTQAHIHSLDGQMDEITVLEELGNNSYLVDYRGVKCSAIFNPFNCTYYADDIYGIIKEKTNNG